MSGLIVLPTKDVEIARKAFVAAGCADIVVTHSLAEARAAIAAGAAFELVLIELELAAGIETDLITMLSDAPVIVVAHDADISAGRAPFAFDFVPPPLAAATLTARARAALRMYRLEQAHRKLLHASCVDPLTGLANRRHALGVIRSELRLAYRNRLEIAIVIVDLDAFHGYNERHGHCGGDDCLRAVSAEMARCLRRPSDLLGRYGGEEFIALMPGTNAAGAQLVAERMRANVEALRLAHGASPTSPFVTISAGFAARVPNEMHTMRELIDAADTWLLRAKAAGRNRVLGIVPPTARLRRKPCAGPFPLLMAGPWLVQRIPRFLADRRQDAHELSVAVEERNLNLVCDLGGRLATTSRELGFDAIAALGSEIAGAAARSDLDRVRAALEQLELYVDRVHVVYRSRVEANLELSQE
jgi:diguanylate cyclase (GGDEF)-like protein